MLVQHIITNIKLYFEEPVILIGEGKYNINHLKEIKVTEDYLGLDQNVRKCQHNKPLQDCTTKHYFDTIMGKCGCIPLSVKLSNKLREVEIPAISQPTITISDI